MRDFDHAETGTPEAEWAADGELRAAAPLDLSGVDRLLVLAAHPDDETLGAAGLVHVAAGRGIPVTIVVATDGEASHPGSTTITRGDLGVLRREESRAAAALLDPRAEVLFADLPDGGLDTQTGALERMLTDRAGPGTLIAAPFGGDGHPDHTAASDAARAAARTTGSRVIEYPIWLWHWGSPAELEGLALRALPLPPATTAAKAAAIDAHRTQVSALSDRPGDEVLLHPAFLAHFHREAEVFVEVMPAVAAGATDALRFDRMLEDDPDPWGAATRWYERRKRAVLLAALPDERLGSVLELGCSTGELSAGLAPRATSLLGVDVSPRAVERARLRNSDSPVCRFEVMQLPDDWPPGGFDLIVVSELAYYLGARERARLHQRIRASLKLGGAVVVCDWRHPMQDSATTGDSAAEEFAALPGFGELARHEEEDFVLLVLMRAPVVSVARAEGLAP